ncbi:MAG TPA: cysteine desulfurase family protein [Alphaproteobacteria bacterium]|nr:cysteine desulfurase family protein [Alphaproteobacteria bacterium]
MGAIYLDHNATAPVLPEAAQAVRAALALTGNPSSVHGFGRAARKLMEDSRAAVAALAGALPEEVTFTSGATEANNLVLGGAGRRRLLVSAIEHVSVLEAAPGATRIPVDGDGLVDLVALEELLRADSEPALVSLMLANNETGVIEPVREAARLAHGHGALFHCDAVQAPGRIRFDVRELDADYLTLSSHKIGGPQGAGVLIVRGGAPLKAQIRGGGQERGRRGGTENLPGIAGFGAAARAVSGALLSVASIEALRDRLEARLLERVRGLAIFGRRAPRLPNTSCFAVAGLASETQVIALDLAGFAVSAGAACSSGRVRASHVLEAMGVEKTLVGSAIRVSLGGTTTAEEIDAFTAAWLALHERLAPRDAA